MRKGLLIFLVVAIYGCNSNKLFKEYKVFTKEKYFITPKEKLRIKFISDSTGLFINKDNNNITTQKFTYTKPEKNVLIINSVSEESDSIILLNKADSLIYYGHELFYPHRKKPTYFIYFKRVL